MKRMYSVFDTVRCLFERFTSSILFFIFTLLSIDVVSAFIASQCNYQQQNSHTNQHYPGRQSIYIRQPFLNSQLHCKTCVLQSSSSSGLSMASNDISSAAGYATAAASSFNAATSTFASGSYVPPEVTPEIYAGSAIAMIPIIWATYEFGSRLQIQKQCLVCNGTGLTTTTRKGNELSRLRKCWACGGFLPWIGWKAFLLSNLSPGNGGVLQRPASDYKEINERILQERMREQQLDNRDGGN